MCGIAGILAPEGQRAPRALLLDMAAALEHRGPDGVGLYVDGRFGMVSTRLAIVDPEGSDMPIGSEDGRIWVMQNGEIYDGPELRRELEALGHVFSTDGDTEVIVHAFEQWGVDALHRMNGDYAFAAWDRTKRRALLARDRFGVRPLYVATFGSTVVFASETEALLRHPAAPRELDATALVDAFSTWGMPPERSAFSGIAELPAGHHQWLGPGAASPPVRWWSLRFGPREGTRTEPRDALAEELRWLLDDATRLRLRADVPVASYLSGGLDSSAIAALASRHSGERLRTFGVGFDDARFDETDHQWAVADALGVQLTTHRVRDADVAAAFPAVVRRAQRPMPRTASAPMYLLSRRVQDAGIRVVLTGEGADELFGGYGLFREAMVRRFWARDPASRLRPRLLARLHPEVALDDPRAEAFLRSFYGRDLANVDDPLYAHGPRFWTASRAVRFLHADVRDEAARHGTASSRLRRRLRRDVQDAGPLGRAQTVEVATFLEGYLLHAQGDRMLMAHGVEGRFPYLDHRVATFAASLPERMRLADLREKPLLRQAVAPLLPQEVAWRPKRPYRAPIARPFFGPSAPEWVEDLVTDGALRRSGLVDVRATSRLLDKARRSGGERMSEGDEMALVGILSTLLLQREGLAERRRETTIAPRREVVGSVVLDGSWPRLTGRAPTGTATASAGGAA